MEELIKNLRMTLMLEMMIMMKKRMSSLDIVALTNFKINSNMHPNLIKNKLKINFKVIFNRIKRISLVRKISMNKICKGE